MADDDAETREALSALLTRWGYQVEQAADGEAALARAVGFRPAVVLTDLVMPGADGLAVLRSLQERLASAAVIVLTGHATVETAVEAIREGAHDYVMKPVDPARLRLVVERALERVDSLTDAAIAAARALPRERRALGELVGGGPAMQQLFRQVELAAPTGTPVLILGESGTGKELVARTIHERSPRARHPFVAVNCSAIPETLLESELFGHERGAFTGAADRRRGHFEIAHRGTIFLDEIAEMSPGLQVKYLRVLQDGSFRRVGGNEEVKVDVRVVAATNKDPLKAIREGRFREDLYYRLSVFAVQVPPLRSRKEDLPLLVDAFLEEFNARYGRRIERADDAVLRLLARYAWPGNVRELRNCIERAVVGCEGPVLDLRALPAGPWRTSGASRPDSVVLPVGTTVAEAERELILKTLRSAGNNKTLAADILGISLKTLHNKLNRYAIDAGSWDRRA